MAHLKRPIDSIPADQIQHAEQLLYEIAETGRYGGGFETFETALDSAIDRAAQAYQSDGRLSGLATSLKDLDAQMGGLQPTDLIIIAGRPGMGKTSLATNIAFNVASAYDATQQSDGSLRPVAGGIVAFFSLEMSSEQLATRVLSEQAEDPLLQHQAWRHWRDRFRQAARPPPENAPPAALYRPDRRAFHRPARGSRTPSETTARPAPHCRRLYSAHAGQIAARDAKSRSGNHGDHDGSESAGKGTQRPCRCAVPALARGRKPRRKASATFRSAQSQARSNKTPTSSCSSFAKSIISRTKSRSPAPTTTSLGKPR